MCSLHSLQVRPDTPVGSQFPRYSPVWHCWLHFLVHVNSSFCAATRLLQTRCSSSVVIWNFSFSSGQTTVSGRRNDSPAVQLLAHTQTHTHVYRKTRMHTHTHTHSPAVTSAKQTGLFHCAAAAPSCAVALLRALLCSAQRLYCGYEPQRLLHRNSTRIHWLRGGVVFLKRQYASVPRLDIHTNFASNRRDKNWDYSTAKNILILQNKYTYRPMIQWMFARSEWRADSGDDMTCVEYIYLLQTYNFNAFILI